MVFLGRKPNLSTSHVGFGKDGMSIVVEKAILSTATGLPFQWMTVNILNLDKKVASYFVDFSGNRSQKPHTVVEGKGGESCMVGLLEVVAP